MVEKQTGYQFGTFKGVFMPSILTILGVVMYLRFGWVLGQVGLLETLLIVTLASSITFLTGLSLAALATNMRVGGGGAYYIISRSLGIEAGAAVGLPLYLAQALGIAFYVAGFSESVCAAFPMYDARLVGVVTLVVLAGLAWWSASIALKTQYLVLGLIAFSLVSFFLGTPMEAVDPEVRVKPLHLYSFWAVFAVFFPAVTGIEAGIAMSGDLKNPARSLPRGTIGAVLAGYLVYLAIPIILHHAVPDANRLVEDPLIMRQVARWGDFVLYGVWAASLSSAMGALLGAPRTLQALARDRVLPRFLGKGFGQGQDPRIATLVSFVIALTGILLGDLNLIAPVLSMFFLTSYALLNLSAGLEDLIGTASWRPKFKIPGWVSLLGFAGCGSAMLMINAGATLVAGVVTGSVYAVMKRRNLRARWGDLRQALMLSVTRELLYRMAGRPKTARTWLPNILVLSGAPSRRWYLIELANAVSQNKGLITVVTMVPETNWNAERDQALTESIRKNLQARDVRALVRVRPTDDVLEGARHVIRNYGFGPLIPNTILIGETEKRENFEEFARLIQLVADTRRNLVVMREDSTLVGLVEKAVNLDNPGYGKPDPSGETEPNRLRQVDVWWQGQSRNIGFMLALAYLLVRSPAWTQSTLNLKMIVTTEEDRESALAQLNAYVEEARIGSSTHTEVLLLPAGQPVFTAIRESSRDADLVVLGMRPPDEGEGLAAYSLYYADLLKHTHDLPPTALVMSAEEIQFHDIFEPEH